jgi:hypothetical protein
VSAPGPTPSPDLSDTLDALVVLADRGGLDRDLARAEGAALAAAVAESAPGAAAEWAAEVGGDVQAFFDAASRGRRWRAAPTAGLAALAAAGSPLTGDYARALVEVTAAACGLGEPSARVIENASVAAAAQLAAGGVGGVTTAAGRSPVLPAAAPLVVPAPDLPSLLGDRAWLNDALARLTPPPGAGPIQPIPPSGPTPSGPTSSGPTPSGPTSSGPGENGSAASGQSAQATATQAATQVEAQPPARTLEELLGELDGLTGLSAVKREIHRQAQLLRVEQLRAAAGLRSPTITRHLVFLGNPGTGKTTVARLVSGIYRALGLLTKGQLIEVDRSELVAGYLGQTATKTAEVVASAIGGVLFIDEAYSLAGDQYGEEAIDTLVKEMEDHRDDLVVVVAGYPAPMQSFIDANPGLASRFRTMITFADYTDDELVEIFGRLAADADYSPSVACRDRFREILAGTARGEGFGNGRFARNVLEAAIGRHAWRLRDVAEPTVQQLRELLPEDLSDADPPAAAAPAAGQAPAGDAGSREGDAMPDVTPVPPDGPEHSGGLDVSEESDSTDRPELPGGLL